MYVTPWWNERKSLCFLEIKSRLICHIPTLQFERINLIDSHLRDYKYSTFLYVCGSIIMQFGSISWTAYFCFRPSFLFNMIIKWLFVHILSNSQLNEHINHINIVIEHLACNFQLVLFQVFIILKQKHIFVICNSIFLGKLKKC